MLQHFGQIRIVLKWQQVTDDSQRRRDAVDEGLFPFPEAAVAVAAEDLEHPEEDEKAEALPEMGFIDRSIGPEGIQIHLQKFFPEGLRIAGAGLPEERCHIVVNGSPAAALEVDEPGFPVHQHDVPGIKIAVQESVGRLGQQVRPEAVEIVLEPDLVKLQPGEFQVVVLEVVQVEVNHPPVKRRLRIAHRKVQSLRALDLDFRKGRHRLTKQRHLVRAVGAPGAPIGQGIIEDRGAKVLLEVAQAVLGQHLGHPDSLRREVTVDGQEGSILIGIGSFHADEGAPIGPGKPEIPPVRSRPGQRHHGHRCRPGILLEQ